MRWRGKEGGVGSHVRPWTRRYGATAIVNQLWLFRARERDTTLWARGLFRPGRMEDKNVSENKLTLLARHRFLGAGNRVLPWHVSTVHSFSLFLLHARTVFFLSLSLSLLLLSLLFSSIEMYKNERTGYKFVRHRISNTIVHEQKYIYIFDRV